MSTLEPGGSYLEAALDGVELPGAQLPKLSLTHARLDRCNLANAAARERRCVARGRSSAAASPGIELAEGTLQDVVFRGCKLDMASFGFARLARVVFDDCVLTGRGVPRGVSLTVGACSTAAT